MKITIQGTDYSSALDATEPLTVERKLNAPSICQFRVSLPSDGSLAVPSRFGYVKVSGDDGTLYFTGYIAASPLPGYVGMGVEGPRYCYAIRALSDELLLNQSLMATSAGSAAGTASALLAAITNRTGSSQIAVSVAANLSVGTFAQKSGTNWSVNAAEVASMARSSYRALNGAITMNTVPAALHVLDETSGTLNLANLSFTSNVKRALANDVTVCGEHEPTAYVTEFFEGDGSTTEFYLTQSPYIPAASKCVIVEELFSESTVNTQVWGNTGGSGYLKIGSGGLVMNGGNGTDGQTVLEWLDAIEMGGTLLLEASGIKLALGSTGSLAGFYNGAQTVSGCIAGFAVSAAQGTGVVSVQPVLLGNLGGSSYALDTTSLYTLRIRLHAAECQRVEQVYRSYGDDGAITAGGVWNLSAGKVQIEIQKYVNGVGATPVTLYDGALSYVPGACSLIAASSTNLLGSMRSIRLRNLGSGWVVSTPSGSSATTRRMGTTAEAAECHMERAGTLAFYTGYAPASGELIAVSYRTMGRAVGRAVNSASQTALAAAGSPSEAAWIGSVTSPEARTSADCRNAATVIEQAAASVSALWSGVYKGTHLDFSADVWPGDALELTATSLSLDAQVVVRSVKLSYRATVPDLIVYEISFANDWANDLAIKTSTTVPEDTLLPAEIAPTVLANLNQVTVSAVGSSTVTIHAGVTPPTGGGFEIRRRDNAFMAGEDSDLVMRATVATMSFSRESYNDRFYIRMYDASTPPKYSEFSAALFINLPVTS
jgi:hypothetical protein